MKNATTIRTMLVLLATVFTMGYTRAAEPFRKSNNAHAAIERELEHALSRHVIFPVMERGNDMTGEVVVSFVVNREGRLEVLSCESENKELEQYVLRKLALVDVGENPDGIWKTTHVRFVFRPETA
ncbi:MAG: hypothetical protein H6595_05740 [Flavobacteriales bacterium]|nr:hypothetical protein [Flavobacteriales bacterium]MCB9166967.1 hypothetical protein [Flavobacteriales bacterium]